MTIIARPSHRNSELFKRLSEQVGSVFMEWITSFTKQEHLCL